MNDKSNLQASQRQLAAEPARDAMDPWPRIRDQVVRSQSRHASRSRPRLVQRHVRALATVGGAAAVLALGVAVMLFANRPQPVSVAEVLRQMEAEAVSVSLSGARPCAPSNETPQTTGNVAFGSGGQPGDSSGPVSSANASQLSDKLAQELGVSGDQVRAAMRKTLSPELPASPPPDPIANIARQLDISTDTVCAAFFDPNGGGFAVSGGASADGHVTTGGKIESGAVLTINGKPINLSTATADQLNEPAKKLGVTPERLLAAVKASIPAQAPALPAPPNVDEIISRFAQNLDMSQDKVRAAITKVEGPNQFYFVVPFSGFGKS